MPTTPLETVFEHMHSWRDLPAYQLERRADVFFSAYMVQAVAEFTGVPLSPQILPELPIKRDLVWPDRPSNQSVKVDYCLFARDRSRVFLVELKTDGASRRESQDHYLERCVEIGFKAIVEGIKQIAMRSTAHQKYAHLLRALERQGCMKLPELLLPYTFPKARPGLRGLQRGIEVTVAEGEWQVEVIYVQPVSDGGRCIDFERFAGVVDSHPDPMSKLFAQSLRRWVNVAGSRLPE